MIAFLTIIYTAVVVLLFKLKLIKPRPFPIAGCVVAGMLLLGGVIIAWTLCAPMSSRVVTTQYVVQIVPYVKGQVKKVHALANQPVKKGDLLLEINPAPYQFTLGQIEAQLLAAKQNVQQASAGVEAAHANVEKSRAAVAQAQAGIDQAKAAVKNANAAVQRAKAIEELARTEETIAVNLQKVDAGAISELKVVQAKQDRIAMAEAVKQAEAGVIQAVAAERQADAGLAVAQSAQQQAEAAERQAGFALEITRSNVVAAEAQRADAKFNLEQCRMYAPGDGYVVNWQVQEGTMIVSLPLSPAGTFVSTLGTTIAASFPQNHLMNVKPGDDVELILDPYPGQLFKCKVETIIPATGEGQFAPSGQIPMASKIGSQGLLAVKIRFEDDAPAQIPLGAGGVVAIYTNVGRPTHIISKVTIRMKKWLLYVLPS